MLRPGRGYTVAAAIVALGIVGWCMWKIRFEKVNIFDEGIVLVYSEQFIKGLAPNRDFFTVYPPGNLWIIGAAYKLFGISIATERWVGAIYRLAILAAVYLFCLPRGRLVAAGGTLIAGWAATFSGLTAFNWTGAMAFAMWSLYLLCVQVRRQSKGYGFVTVAGMLAACTATIRADMPAVAVLLAAIPMLRLVTNRHKIFYALGWAIGFTPFLVHVRRAGLRNVINNLFIQPITRIGPARRLPIIPFESSSATMLFFLTMISIALVIIAFGLRIRKHRQAQDWIYFSLAIFILCITPQALQRSAPDHYMYVAQIAWGVTPVAMTMLMEPLIAPRFDLWNQVLAVSLLANVLHLSRLMCPVVFGTDAHAWQLTPSTPHLVLHRGRYMPMGSESERASISGILDFVEQITKPGDRIFIGPGDLRFARLNDVYLYFLLPQLTPASYYMEVNPGSTNTPDSRVPGDLATADIVILNDPYTEPPEQNDTAKPGSPEASQMLESKFYVCKSAGPFTIYLRKP